MRRAQSVRHRTRESLSGNIGTATSSAQLALHTDELGALREGDESDADVLRKQLLEKDRECDRLKTNLSLLQSQLTLRPPVEHVQALEREYKDLELLLQGTQRENERCMAEMERMKIREKMLERELARLAGDNWQEALDISPPPPPTAATLGRSSAFHQRSNTAPNISSGSSSAATTLSPLNPNVNSTTTLVASPTQDAESINGSGATDSAVIEAHIEKVRLLILGMETRLSKREEHLQGMVKRAENEGRRWEEVSRA